MPLLTNNMPLSGIKAGFLTVIPATSCLSQQIDPTDCRIRFKVKLMYYFALQVGVFEEFLCVLLFSQATLQLFWQRFWLFRQRFLGLRKG